MRWLAFGGFLLVVALATPASAVAVSCPPPGVKVLAESGPLSVYASPTGYGQIRACRSGAPSIEVGSTECDDVSCHYDRVLATTGSCIALELHEIFDRAPADPVYDSWSLGVVDVRLVRGWRYRLRFIPLEDSRSRGLGAIGPVSAVAFGSGCAVAWINALAVGSAAEVRTSDTRGRLLRARAVDIDPMSLKRSGTTVTWTQGGLPRSAPLSGAPPWRR